MDSPINNAYNKYKRSTPKNNKCTLNTSNNNNTKLNIIHIPIKRQKPKISYTNGNNVISNNNSIHNKNNNLFMACKKDSNLQINMRRYINNIIKHSNTSSNMGNNSLCNSKSNSRIIRRNERINIPVSRHSIKRLSPQPINNIFVKKRCSNNQFSKDKYQLGNTNRYNSIESYRVKDYSINKNNYHNYSKNK